MSDYKYLQECRQHVEERCRDRTNSIIEDLVENQEIKQIYFLALVEHEAHRAAFPIWNGFPPDLEDITSMVRWNQHWNGL